MARSVSMQFTFLSREAAKKYLDAFGGEKGAARTADNVGDRIAAARRLDYVTTEAERRAARADAARYGRPLKPWV